MMNYDYQNFLVELREDGIVVITASRPEKLNAMNELAWQELGDFFARADHDPAIRVIILTGAGDKAFIAGADISALAKKTGVTALASQAYQYVTRIETCSKPVIAAVNGYAFGGGFEIAMGCDFRICSENAVFALPETGLGIIPGSGGTQRLSRLTGMARAKEIIMLGRKLNAQEALQWGIVTRCVPREALMEEAFRMARHLMEKGPIALNVAKKLIRASLSCDMDLGLVMENMGLGILCASEDKQEGLNSFLEKRKPEYRGK